jgi:hypothetical protein
MKNKITISLLSLLTLSLGVFAQTAVCDGTLPFEEKDGLLTIEMESGVINDSRWLTGTEMENVNGEQKELKYIYWTGAESFNALSGAPITYKIKINNPGTYRFAWRMSVGNGTSTSEHNDAWLKIDGEDFYGIRDVTKVYPKPMCNQNANLTCAAGSSTQNFVKAYGNRLDWGFVTFTNDGSGHRIFVTFNEAKEYTITVDARSSYLFIDKMVLKKNGVSDSVAFNLTNSESTCYDAGLSLNVIKNPEIILYPNPTTGKIQIKNLPINTTLSITNILGSKIKNIKTTSSSQTIDISDLKNGIYFISNIDKYNYFIKKIIKL